MESVLVQFLGSGDAFGSGGRLQPCISLRARLDCRGLILTHPSDDMLAHLPNLPDQAAHDGLLLEL